MNAKEQTSLNPNILWLICDKFLDNYNRYLLLSKIPQLRTEFLGKNSKIFTILFQFEGFDYENCMPSNFKKRLESQDYLIVEIPLGFDLNNIGSKDNMDHEITLLERIDIILPVISFHSQTYKDVVFNFDIAVNMNDTDIYKTIDFYPLIHDKFKDIKHSLNILRKTSCFNQFTKSQDRKFSLFDKIDEVITPNQQEFIESEACIKLLAPTFRMKGDKYVRSSTFFQNVHSLARYKILGHFSSLKSISVICPLYLGIISNQVIYQTQYLTNMYKMNSKYRQTINNILKTQYQDTRTEEIDNISNTLRQIDIASKTNIKTIDENFVTSPPDRFYVTHPKITREETRIKYESLFRYYNAKEISTDTFSRQINHLPSTTSDLKAELAQASRFISLSDHFQNLNINNISVKHRNGSLESEVPRLIRLEILSSSK